MYINSENQLQKLDAPVFGIDIEFSNQKICLIQVSDGQNVFLFDPILVELKQYMTEFFLNDSIKVFYSGAQDLKWLNNEYKITVKNYCDLKVLAQKEPDVSLIALWKKYCGVEFAREDKKRLQKSDWFSRPLTEEQLHYAALDCQYLVMLREILLKQYNEDEIKYLHFSTDLKEPKLLRYLKSQLEKHEDILLPQKIYQHIKFNEPFQTDDEKVLSLIEQLTKKHHEDYKEQKRQRFLIFQEKFTTRKPVYSNCRIFSKNGQQLCFCDQKKIQWYVKNGLGEFVDEKSVKLNFDPVQEFDEKEMKFYNEERSNRCVVCGASQNILKYQVIPYMYKHHLPNNYKSHRAHDVVILCARCHEKASALQDKKRAEIAKIYNVPLLNFGQEKQVVDKLTYLLKKCDNIGKAGKEFDHNEYLEAREKLKHIMELPEQFNKQDIAKLNEQLKKDLKNTHGEEVAKKLDTDDKIEEFIMIFRKHFLASMDPQFLPKEWAIDHRFKRNFEFDASFMSRLFYFTMHFICWTILVVYNKNPFIDQPFGVQQICFILLVIYSNYLFMTVGQNPGYINIVNEDDVELQIVEEQINKRYCNICKFNIPSRAKHCKVCKRCVAKFDHHCFWVGGCVGELNHRGFWLFLLIQSIVIILLLWYCEEALSNYDYYEKDKKRYGQEYGAYMVIFVIMFLFLLFSGGMLIFHSYLILVGVTTYELLKKFQLKRTKTSIFQNLKQTFCHGGILQQWENE